MKKTISLLVIVIILAVIALGIQALVPGQGEPTGQQPAASSTPIGKVSGNATTFASLGTLSFTTSTPPTDGVMLSYMEGGARISTTTLYFDELSACAAPNGAQPCLEFNVPLSAPFGGKTVLVEGIHQGEGIIVRKMMTQEPGDHPHVPEVGRVYISWPQARMFITSCAPKMIMQTHDLDIKMQMADGSFLYAVEPVIDEVFKVTKEAEAECGVIPTATE
jgi:hypothetical protein